MAGRIRTIKPEILEDERSAGLSSDAWRLWVSMWLLADDHGRLRGNHQYLEGQIFWLAKPRESLARLLESLEMADLVIRYEVNGQKYIEIPNWSKHQRVDHPGKPRVPPPSEGTIESKQADRPKVSRDSRETLARDAESVEKVSGTLAPDHDHDHDHDQRSQSGFDLVAIFAAYPKAGTSSQGKAKGLEGLKKAIKSQRDYDRVLAAAKRYAAEEEAFKRSGSKSFRPAVPMFSTWVNQRRWEDFDELPLTAQSTAPKQLTAEQRIAAREAAEAAEGVR